MVFFSSWWHNWWFGVNKQGAINAYATALPKEGPYNSVQLGMLRQLDQMVTDLEKASGTQVHLTMLLRERAMAALPESTAALLRVSRGDFFSCGLGGLHQNMLSTTYIW